MDIMTVDRIINEPTAAASRTAWTRPIRTRRSWSSTSVVAPSTSRCWRSATAFSR